LKKILILGPLWRNRRIVKRLKKNYKVFLHNKKIDEKYIKFKKVDFLITSGYPFLVKKKILKIVKIKINLHISYLPYGRGTMPNLWCFYEGFPPGITIHELDANFDTGKIIVQKKVSFKSLKIKTLKTTHDFLLIQLENFFFKNYKKIFEKKFKPYPQNKLIKKINYHNRLESENLIDKFPKKWNTRIEEILNFKKINEISNIRRKKN
tara:strand:- start:211 stop:834 length:624 start_codon:yes stop_codon:yes gene_type:complete